MTIFGQLSVNASCSLLVPLADDTTGVITRATKVFNLPIALPSSFSDGLANFNGSVTDGALVSQSILQVGSSEFTQHCAFGAQGSGVGSFLSGTFTLVNAAPTVRSRRPTGTGRSATSSRPSSPP